MAVEARGGRLTRDASNVPTEKANTPVLATTTTKRPLTKVI